MCAAQNQVFFERFRFGDWWLFFGYFLGGDDVMCSDVMWYDVMN